MPLAMANLWLILGALLIAGVMLATMLIPRPNAEYAISEPPFQFGSPGQNASPDGQGHGGAPVQKPRARPEPSDAEPKSSAQPDARPEKSDPRPSKSQADASHDKQSSQKPNGAQGPGKSSKEDKPAPSSHERTESSHDDHPSSGSSPPPSETPRLPLDLNDQMPLTVAKWLAVWNSDRGGSHCRLEAPSRIGDRLA